MSVPHPSHREALFMSIIQTISTWQQGMLIGTQKVNLYMMFISYNIYLCTGKNAEQPNVIYGIKVQYHYLKQYIINHLSYHHFFYQILLPLSTPINHHKSSILSSRSVYTHAFAMAEKYQMHPNKLPRDKFACTYSKCLLMALFFSRHWEQPWPP